jgi:GNAT superfamily N-acetyltransferase
VEDEKAIFHVINESAKVYRGVIAEDRYHEPYMPLSEIRREMSQMTFFAYEHMGRVLGVAGYQHAKDVSLVRHFYVLPEHQRKGIGSALLDSIIRTADTRRVLVGTWKDAQWAIRFYEKHGFTLLSGKDELLRKYWKIPERQTELSVVLGIDTPRQTHRLAEHS